MKWLIIAGAVVFVVVVGYVVVNSVLDERIKEQKRNR